jgi:hypothetical protein
MQFTHLYDQIKERVGLPFKNANHFCNAVDMLPAPHKPLTCKKVKLIGNLRTKAGKHRVEMLELWTRDIVDVVEDLLGNATFRDHTAFKPEKVYHDKGSTNHIYDETWTCDWWAEMQVCLLIITTAY